jgi:hypothetical protein
MIGFLLYLAAGTRPDIAYALNKLARHVANTSNEHVQQANRVLFVTSEEHQTLKSISSKASSRKATVTRTMQYTWLKKSRTGFLIIVAGGAVG